MTALGLGCMGLSALPAERAIEVVHAAVERGVRLLDTADVYGPTAADSGHNERLLGEALATSSATASVRVATKGGLIRRDRGPWQVDGRRKHLLAAAEASCERLGRPADLFLLHAPPPAARLDTALRALAAIRERGLAAEVGVCNVRLGALQRAMELAPIRAVQVSLGPFDDTALRGGVVGAALEAGLEVLVHSPFGGPRKAPRLGRLPGLVQASAELHRSPWAAVLGWLHDLGLTALPGPTTVEHVSDLFPLVELTASVREQLDASFPAARILRTSQAARRPRADATGDVVLLMGSPASGKTTAVGPLVDRGYLRLNRDRVGGSLAKVADALDTALSEGHRRVVLDNTYPSRAQRNRVIETAWAHEVPVRCLFKDTSMEEAQLNACLRMVRRHGRLLEPEEMKKLSRTEPNSFPPRVLLQWPAKLEPPSADEGLRTIETLPFERAPLGPGRAVICDPRELVPTDRAVLEAHRDAGWLLFAAGWTGGGPGAQEVSVDGLALPTSWCTHPPGPPICWCRPPLPGLAAQLMIHHQLGTVRTLEQARTLRP